MSNTPKGNVINLHTERDIRESYDVNQFIDFVARNNIQIASGNDTSGNWTGEYTPRTLGVKWQECLDILIQAQHNKAINLSVLISNYKTVNIQHRRTVIVKTLQDIVASKLTDEASNEAFLIGLGMLFGDNLDFSNANSLVHHYRDRIIEIEQAS